MIWNIGELKALAYSLDNQLKKAAESLTAARDQEAEAKVAFENAKDAVTREQSDLYLALVRANATNPDMWIDPVTQENTEDWRARVATQMIETDPGYQAKEAAFRTLRNELYRISTKAVSMAEEISAIKTRARLVSVVIAASLEEQE